MEKWLANYSYQGSRERDKISCDKVNEHYCVVDDFFFCLYVKIFTSRIPDIQTPGFTESGYLAWSVCKSKLFMIKFEPIVVVILGEVDELTVRPFRLLVVTTHRLDLHSPVIKLCLTW